MHYTILMQDPTGHDSMMQDLVLGALIAVGNQMLASVTYYIGHSFLFIEKDRHEVLILAMVFWGSFINTACDLAVIVYISRGAILDNLLYGEASHDGYDQVVSRGVAQFLVPGYLLLPYLMAPIFENVIPFILSKWLVASRRDISLSDAERNLELPDFDICWRYADILNVFTITLIMVLFTTPYAHRVMSVLAVILFSLDRYRVLRYTSKTTYTTESLSAAFSYWWALPTASLAGATAWWAAEIGAIPMSSIGAFLAVVPIHCFFYCVVLWRLRAWISDAASKSAQEEPSKAGLLMYGDACEQGWQRGHIYSYFSTNFAHVFRTRLLHEDAIMPCPESSWLGGAPSTWAREAIGAAARMPSARGKEHMQPRLPQSKAPSLQAPWCLTSDQAG
eukprot:CAMPEP_0180557048 /NCGR_PEP_ID=MMETSP1037_2-20121125/948_1 /TAXON_ID=632150 /ORGANISM="Azadinium spinosum, Strain 3D9" /LENGTH=391 /DNA_ID=CAMNT_0022573213 /DNA_START=1 /DNA_END=1171 /DNA_ORIENTATION=+